MNEGGSNSVVESQPSKLLVAGSIPVSRSRLRSLASLPSFVSAGQHWKSVAPKLRSSEGGLDEPMGARYLGRFGSELAGVTQW